MAAIWYEVFPVTVVSKRAVLIRREEERTNLPWMIPHQQNRHPNDIVVKHLFSFFGHAFDLRRTIVHSTSWRYDSDELLLTYLAVLPQGSWLDRWVARGRIVIEPIGAIEIGYGGHLSAPEFIEHSHVLAHALDHLAALSSYDEAIQAVLEAEWGEVLRPRLPRAAGCLQVCY